MCSSSSVIRAGELFNQIRLCVEATETAWRDGALQFWDKKEKQPVFIDTKIALHCTLLLPTHPRKCNQVQPQIGHKHHYRQQKPAVCHHDTYKSSVCMLRCQMFLLNVGRVSYNERNTCKSSPWLLWKHLLRLFFFFFFLPSQRSDDILMTARLFRPGHTKYEDATVHRHACSCWGDKRRPWLPIWFIFYGENGFCVCVCVCVCVCLRSDVLRLFCRRCLYLLLKVTSNCCRLVVSKISPAGWGPIRLPRASKPANWAN